MLAPVSLFVLVVYVAITPQEPLHFIFICVTSFLFFLLLQSWTKSHPWAGNSKASDMPMRTNVASPDSPKFASQPGAIDATTATKPTEMFEVASSKTTEALVATPATPATELVVTPEGADMPGAQKTPATEASKAATMDSEQQTSEAKASELESSDTESTEVFSDGNPETISDESSAETNPKSSVETKPKTERDSFRGGAAHRPTQIQFDPRMMVRFQMPLACVGVHACAYKSLPYPQCMPPGSGRAGGSSTH